MDQNASWHHSPMNNERESDETSRIFYGHADFPEMNGGIKW